MFRPHRAASLETQQRGLGAKKQTARWSFRAATIVRSATSIAILVMLTADQNLAANVIVA
jgi:hypothetical protein